MRDLRFIIPILNYFALHDGIPEFTQGHVRSRSI